MLGNCVTHFTDRLVFFEKPEHWTLISNSAENAVAWWKVLWITKLCLGALLLVDYETLCLGALLLASSLGGRMRLVAQPSLLTFINKELLGLSDQPSKLLVS
jgi:hypothetical protein